MLKLHDIEDKVTISLDIESYQFKQNISDNWLNVALKIIQEKHSFKALEPALETFELVDLYNWFEQLSVDELPEYSTLYFSEPCLEFSFLGKKDQKVRIAIQFNLEFKPNFKYCSFLEEVDEWNVVFDITQEIFLIILKNIKELLVRFPIRK